MYEKQYIKNAELTFEIFWLFSVLGHHEQHLKEVNYFHSAWLPLPSFSA